MSKKQFGQIFQSFILVPFLATSMSISTISAQVDSAIGLEIKDEQAAQAQAERVTKANKIDTYFEKNNMPLKGNGMNMVLAAEKAGLDWRLIPAMSVRESTGGRFACKKFPENAWGWHSCKSGLGGSTEKAIELMAQHLSGQHPKTSQYYKGKTTIKILETYNPRTVVATYPEEVMKIMDRIENTEIELASI